MKTCARCHTVRPLAQFKPGCTHCIWCVESVGFADSLEHIDPPKQLQPVALHKRQTRMKRLTALTEEIGGYDAEFAAVASADEGFDPVTRPRHYARSAIEVIDAIEAWELDFCCANAVKYVARAPHKGSEIQDLEKACWYLQRRIKQLKARDADTKTGGKK